jgi:alpha-ribazole phosphatase
VVRRAAVKLHLVRHPRPVIAPGVCYGASDVPVPESELALVHAALAEVGLPGDLPVYASPLRRCALLARRLQPRRLEFDARLAEMDFGAWELRRWDAIPRAEVDAWVADLLHYRPGGAENVMDVARRVAAFVADLRAAGASDSMVICHAGTIRLLSAMRPGAPLEQAALRAAEAPHRTGYGDVIVVDV